MTTRTFLSYSRRNADVAQMLSEQLDALGLDVLRDTEEILPAEDWRERLRQLILDADAIVFLVSEQSAVSEVCAWEVEFGASRSRKIIPVLIEDVVLDSLSPLLTRLNFIDATGDKALDHTAKKIVQAVEQDIQWIREHSRYDRQAVRWTNEGKPRSRLLRGGDIAAAEEWRDDRGTKAPGLTTEQSDFIAESRKMATRGMTRLVSLGLVVAAITSALAVAAWIQADHAAEAQNLAELREADATRSRSIAEVREWEAQSARKIAQERETEAIEARLLAERRSALLGADKAMSLLAQGDVEEALGLLVDGARWFDESTVPDRILIAFDRALAASRIRRALRIDEHEAIYINRGRVFVTDKRGRQLKELNGRSMFLIGEYPDRIISVSAALLDPRTTAVLTEDGNIFLSGGNGNVDYRMDEYRPPEGMRIDHVEIRSEPDFKFLRIFHLSDRSGVSHRAIQLFDLQSGFGVTSVPVSGDSVLRFVVSEVESFIAFNGEHSFSSGRGLAHEQFGILGSTDQPVSYLSEIRRIIRRVYCFDDPISATSRMRDHAEAFFSRDGDAEYTNESIDFGDAKHECRTNSGRIAVRDFDYGSGGTFPRPSVIDRDGRVHDLEDIVASVDFDTSGPIEPRSFVTHQYEGEESPALIWTAGNSLHFLSAGRRWSRQHPYALSEVRVLPDGSVAAAAATGKRIDIHNPFGEVPETTMRSRTSNTLNDDDLVSDEPLHIGTCAGGGHFAKRSHQFADGLQVIFHVDTENFRGTENRITSDIGELQLPELRCLSLSDDGILGAFIDSEYQIHIFDLRNSLSTNSIQGEVVLRQQSAASSVFFVSNHESIISAHVDGVVLKWTKSVGDSDWGAEEYLRIEGRLISAEPDKIGKRILLRIAEGPGGVYGMLYSVNAGQDWTSLGGAYKWYWMGFLADGNVSVKQDLEAIILTLPEFEQLRDWAITALATWPPVR
jgi:hypothetical protein